MRIRDLLKDVRKPTRILALAKNADNDEETLTFEVLKGFRGVYRGSKMKVNRILPGLPVEVQVSFDGKYATVTIQDGSPPEIGSIYIVLHVTNS